MMMSKRVDNMSSSATVELNNKVVELLRQGRDIIKFNIGEPDFNTPDNIKIAAVRAIHDNFTRYTDVAGILEMREAICSKLLSDNDLVYSPGEISVSNGAKQAIANTLLALCDPGDEVIIPTPCWVSYSDMVKLAGGIPVFVKTDEDHYFQPDLARIERSITAKTKAILINTPNNPTGAVYSLDTLKAIGELALKHNIYIISDEIYEKLTYKGKSHKSVAALSPEICAKTLVVNGLSKAYAMTGWRIGYVAGPKEIIRGVNLIQGHLTANINSIAQKACVTALTGPQDSVLKMRNQFDERRRFAIAKLREMKFIDCIDPDGAFYLLPNIAKLCNKSFKGHLLKDSFDVATFFLEEALVAVVPGAAFMAPDHVRIAYSNSMEKIALGMERMANALAGIH
jgi:aspartate aminotransferase